MGCCSRKAVKWTLFSFNLILTIGQIFPIFSGAVSLSYNTSVSVRYIVVGSILIAVGIWGFYAILKKQRTALFALTVILALAFVSEIAVIVINSRELVHGMEYLPDESEFHLLPLFEQYGNGSAPMDSMVDKIQQLNSCCGFYDLSEWTHHKHWGRNSYSDVPDSCCKVTFEGCGVGASDNRYRIHTEGCWLVIEEDFYRTQVAEFFILSFIIGVFEMLLQIPVIILFYKYSKMVHLREATAGVYYKVQEENKPIEIIEEA